MRPTRRDVLRWTGLCALWLIRLLVLVMLPFFLLIRTSLHLHLAEGWPVWLSLALGAALMTTMLAGYAAWLTQRFTGSRRISRLALGSLTVLVVCYSTFALLYLSRTNAKSEEIRSFYGSVHPILRVAVGTLILVNGDLILTDTKRTPGDYAAMGLRPRPRSLHFQQPDGYVHAVDLRTVGRAEWRNGLIRAYFALMGFPTLRHVGTSDHLHVSLQAESAAARPLSRARPGLWEGFHAARLPAR